MFLNFTFLLPGVSAVRQNVGWLVFPFTYLIKNHSLVEFFEFYTNNEIYTRRFRHT